MKIILLTALLLATSTCVYTQAKMKPAAKPASHTEQELIRLNQELIDALARGDKSVANRIYADDFVRITVQGGVLTKAQVLESLKAPEAGVKISYESKDIKVFDYGNTAILVYLSIRHTDNKGERSDFFYRVTDTFVKRDGRWIKAASVGTPIPKEVTMLSRGTT
jgi:ketosteroid isomerase-like protein